MKKSTFIGNLVVWIVVAAVCGAFLVWWQTGEGTANISDPVVQLGVVLAAPMLLYAIGALAGLALLWFKKIRVGRITKLVCRVIGILALAFVLFAGVPVFVPDAGSTLLAPVVVVVYVSMVAPLLIVALGAVYAVGCAGVSPDKHGASAASPSDDNLE